MAVAPIANVELSPSAVASLIEQWQRHPCLFNVKSTEFKVRNMRIIALNNIKQEMNSNYDIEQIKKKMKTIRNQYQKEKVLFEKSKKPGAGTVR